MNALRGFSFSVVHVNDLDSVDLSDVDVVYVNFTDGLGIAARVVERLHAPIFVTRMRSSHLERGRFDRFLWAVPDDLLYRLTAGQHIVFVDGGSRRADCIPRTIWLGMPLLLRVALRIIWCIDVPIALTFLAGRIGVDVARGVDMLVADAAKRLEKPLRARIRYWRRYATEKPMFKLTAVYGCAALDATEAAKLHDELKELLNDSNGA